MELGREENAVKKNHMNENLDTNKSTQDANIETSENKVSQAKTTNEEFDDLDISTEKTPDESIVTKIKKSFQTKKFKGGAYSTVLSCIVIVMVLVVNLFMSKLDIKFDVSSNKIFTLSSESKEFAKTVKDDITIYYLVSSGKEDPTFTKIVEKYAKLSDKFKLVYKDPDLYPQFASQYTEEEVTDNSFIVVNKENNRAKYVDNSDLYKSEVDYTTYQSTITAYDVEGQLTSAIEYVTTENLPKMYMIKGHGEDNISDVFNDQLAKSNVTTDTLNTLTTDKIPDDCSVLLINAPQNDYTENEVKMIKEFLGNGGDAIILADYNTNGLDNFNSLLEYYGVQIVKGIVVETSLGYYMGNYPNYLVPNIESTDITSDLKSDKTSVVLPNASGIQILDSKRSTVEITPLLTTSDKAYSKTNIKSETSEKEDGDIDGPFNLGVSIKETYNEKETKIVVFGSKDIINEQMLSYTAIGNLSLIVKSVNFITDKESSISVPDKSVGQEYISLNAAQANFWSAFVVIIIPLIILVIGGVICLRRRKK